MDPLSDAKIVDSWSKNAGPWAEAVREGRIDSRRLVTDRAVVDAVRSRSPRSGLDIGCGEGWLVRALDGIAMIGVDGVPALVEQARKAGGGDFRVASYEEIAAGALRVCVDVAVCNFALLGKESVEGVFRAVPSLLTPGGAFVVQTIHPVTACGDAPYRDGWREGSWAGFTGDFTDPAPWYFRTLASWVRLFVDHAFRLVDLREPVHPETQQPASVIFVGEVAG